MPNNVSMDNPFKVFTPEGMTAEDTVELFVEVSDFKKIQDPGHTMLNGPRGSGKSMLFRYLMPDCQSVAKQVPVSKLTFFGVLISIKNTAPNITELRRLDDQVARTILNEHVLACFVASKVLAAVKKALPTTEKESWLAPTRRFHDAVVVGALRVSGWDGDIGDSPDWSVADLLDNCSRLCEQAYSAVNLYAKRIAFHGTEIEYTGALCDFLTFLYPIIEGLEHLPYLPDGPTYLLIDDADYLSLDQTRVLNSWLATRTQHVVSIKVSTQLNYKTFATIGGQHVRSPHDFQEINIADLYTSKKGSYVENVQRIVEKRLHKANISIPAAEFFPVDSDQEQAVEAIKEEIRSRWESEGRGNRVSDDVVRYARPEYIRRLGGTAKSTSTYSYAGLDQLIHISSGLVRYFLQPAAEMFDEQRALDKNGEVEWIRPGIQNSVVRREAENLMFKEFEDLRKDADCVETPINEHQEEIEKLRNLIRFLGNTFYQKLISQDAERKVFSVAISGEPDRDVLSVFEMGVRYGFFHRSSIGNKDGTGRTRLYVLTRRLAPHFNLDPSSFAGYLFVTNSVLREAMADPDRVLRNAKKHGVDQILDDGQLDLLQS